MRAGKGPHLRPENYGDDELRFGDRNFIEQDPLIEPRTFRNTPDDGEHLYVGRVLGISRCVGGGTVHYGAVSFRYRPEDFRAKSYWGSLSGADIVDWPFDYEELRPYYGRVERLIGVAGGQLREQASPGAPVPGAEWRADRYPMPGHPPNYGAKLFEDAATRLGLHPYPTPVAINNLARRRPRGVLLLRLLLESRLPDRSQERHPGYGAAQGAGHRTAGSAPRLLRLPGGARSARPR